MIFEAEGFIWWQVNWSITGRQEPLSHLTGLNCSDIFRPNLGRLETPGLAISAAEIPGPDRDIFKHSGLGRHRLIETPPPGS